MIALPQNRFHMLLTGHVLDKLRELPDESVDCIMTSPPYFGLRFYKGAEGVWGGDPKCKHDFSNAQPADLLHENRNNRRGTQEEVVAKPTGTTYIRKKGSATEVASCSKCNAWRGQLGLEPDYRMYLDHLLMVTAELKRVLKKSGTLWWNMGDTYSAKPTGTFNGGGVQFEGRDTAGIESSGKVDKTASGVPAKSLMLMPERLSMRMVDEQGWVLRNMDIWHKPSHMPSSVTDRLSNSYEFVMFFTKAQRYFFDLDAIRVPLSPDTHPYGKNGSFEATMDAPTWPTWGINGSQSLRGKKYRRYRSGNKERKVEQFRLPHLGSSIPWSAEDSPGGKNPGDFWEINPRPHPFAHFAVYPVELCYMPIIAGCPSEICTKCGKAKERLTEVDYEVLRKSSITDQPKVRERIEDGDNPNMSGLKVAVARRRSRTAGWKVCQCNAPFRPGITLDPFAGSGTTGVAARQLGRSSILIEISDEYCSIIRKRMEWGQQSLDGSEWIEG